MSLPFAFPTAGRPPRADGPPVVASPPPEAATGDLIARLRDADWSDQRLQPDDFFPPLADEARFGTPFDLVMASCLVVVVAVASAMIGGALGFLAAQL